MEYSVKIAMLFCLITNYFNLKFKICSLTPLVRKVEKERVVEMTSKLCIKLLNVKDPHRDIACIALKAIVDEVSAQTLVTSILQSLIPQLIKGITGPVSSYFA